MVDRTINIKLELKGTTGAAKTLGEIAKKAGELTDAVRPLNEELRTLASTAPNAADGLEKLLQKMGLTNVAHTQQTQSPPPSAPPKTPSTQPQIPSTPPSQPSTPQPITGTGKQGKPRDIIKIDSPVQEPTQSKPPASPVDDGIIRFTESGKFKLPYGYSATPGIYRPYLREQKQREKEGKPIVEYPDYLRAQGYVVESTPAPTPPPNLRNEGVPKVTKHADIVRIEEEKKANERVASGKKNINMIQALENLSSEARQTDEIGEYRKSTSIAVENRRRLDFLKGYKKTHGYGFSSEKELQRRNEAMVNEKIRIHGRYSRVPTNPLSLTDFPSLPPSILDKPTKEELGLLEKIKIAPGKHDSILRSRSRNVEETLPTKEKISLLSKIYGRIKQAPTVSPGYARAYMYALRGDELPKDKPRTWINFVPTKQEQTIEEESDKDWRFATEKEKVDSKSAPERGVLASDVKGTPLGDSTWVTPPKSTKPSKFDTQKIPSPKSKKPIEETQQPKQSDEIRVGSLDRITSKWISEKTPEIQDSIINAINNHIDQLSPEILELAKNSKILLKYGPEYAGNLFPKGTGVMQIPSDVKERSQLNKSAVQHEFIHAQGIDKVVADKLVGMYGSYGESLQAIKGMSPRGTRMNDLFKVLETTYGDTKTSDEDSLRDVANLFLATHSTIKSKWVDNINNTLKDVPGRAKLPTKEGLEDILDIFEPFITQEGGEQRLLHYFGGKKPVDVPKEPSKQPIKQPAKSEADIKIFDVKPKTTTRRKKKQEIVRLDEEPKDDIQVFDTPPVSDIIDIPVVKPKEDKPKEPRKSSPRKKKEEEKKSIPDIIEVTGKIADVKKQTENIVKEVAPQIPRPSQTIESGPTGLVPDLSAEGYHIIQTPKLVSTRSELLAKIADEIRELLPPDFIVAPESNLPIKEKGAPKGFRGGITARAGRDVYSTEEVTALVQEAYVTVMGRYSDTDVSQEGEPEVHIKSQPPYKRTPKKKTTEPTVYEILDDIITQGREDQKKRMLSRDEYQEARAKEQRELAKTYKPPTWSIEDAINAKHGDKPGSHFEISDAGQMVPPQDKKKGFWSKFKESISGGEDIGKVIDRLAQKGGALGRLSWTFTSLAMSSLGVYFSLIGVTTMLQRGINTVLGPLGNLQGLIEGLAWNQKEFSGTTLDLKTLLGELGIGIGDVARESFYLKGVMGTLTGMLGAFGTLMLMDPEVKESIEGALNTLKDFLFVVDKANPDKKIINPELMDLARDIFKGIKDALPEVLKGVQLLGSLIQNYILPHAGTLAKMWAVSIIAMPIFSAASAIGNVGKALMAVIHAASGATGFLSKMFTGASLTGVVGFGKALLILVPIISVLAIASYTFYKAWTGNWNNIQGKTKATIKDLSSALGNLGGSILALANSLAGIGIEIGELISTITRLTGLNVVNSILFNSFLIFINEMAIGIHQLSDGVEWLIKQINKIPGIEVEVEDRPKGWIETRQRTAIAAQEAWLATRASGGPLKKGEAALVGEQGPEIIIPTSDVHVLSNKQSKELAEEVGFIGSVRKLASGTGLQLPSLSSVSDMWRMLRSTDDNTDSVDKNTAAINELIGTWSGVAYPNSLATIEGAGGPTPESMNKARAMFRYDKLGGDIIGVSPAKTKLVTEQSGSVTPTKSTGKTNLDSILGSIKTFAMNPFTYIAGAMGYKYIAKPAYSVATGVASNIGKTVTRGAYSVADSLVGLPKQQMSPTTGATPSSPLMSRAGQFAPKAQSVSQLSRITDTFATSAGLGKAIEATAYTASTPDTRGEGKALQWFRNMLPPIAGGSQPPGPKKDETFQKWYDERQQQKQQMKLDRIKTLPPTGNAAVESGVIGLDQSITEITDTYKEGTRTTTRTLNEANKLSSGSHGTLRDILAEMKKQGKTTDKAMWSATPGEDSGGPGKDKRKAGWQTGFGNFDDVDMSTVKPGDVIGGVTVKPPFVTSTPYIPDRGGVGGGGFGGFGDGSPTTIWDTIATTIGGVVDTVGNIGNTLGSAATAFGDKLGGTLGGIISTIGGVANDVLSGGLTGLVTGGPLGAVAGGIGGALGGLIKKVVPSLATGGVIEQTGLVNAHAGEIIAPKETILQMLLNKLKSMWGGVSGVNWTNQTPKVLGQQTFENVIKGDRRGGSGWDVTRYAPKAKFGAESGKQITPMDFSTGGNILSPTYNPLDHQYSKSPSRDSVDKEWGITYPFKKQIVTNFGKTITYVTDYDKGMMNGIPIDAAEARQVWMDGKPQREEAAASQAQADKWKSMSGDELRAAYGYSSITDNTAKTIESVKSIPNVTNKTIESTINSPKLTEPYKITSVTGKSLVLNQEIVTRRPTQQSNEVVTGKTEWGTIESITPNSKLINVNMVIGDRTESKTVDLEGGFVNNPNETRWRDAAMRIWNAAGSPTTASDKNYKSLDLGGMITKTGMVKAHAGEVISPVGKLTDMISTLNEQKGTQTTSSSPQNVSINITINGNADKDVTDDMIRKIKKELYGRGMF